MADLNVLTFCGSLRKRSYNAMVEPALPSLAPEGMTVKAGPSFAQFPLYNADVQDSSGFPAPVNSLADAIRAADGVIIVSPEYNFSIPGGLKNAIDWVSRLANQRFAGKPIACSSLRLLRNSSVESPPKFDGQHSMIGGRSL
jgi:chromate reductase